ncbi:Pr6Pr family membrane protein [Nocardioides sp. NPDC057772]|uniref:Pr6Pr family membrane protein n=1 Tax=Nocardioides sp. NPDC057772 TaxID=3346245 RepID=UPI00366A5EFC
MNNGASRRVAAARVWHGLLAVVVLTALVIQFVNFFTGGADANSGASGAGVPLGVRIVRGYSFFTVDSNIVVMIVSIMLVANPTRSGRWWDTARLNALLAIAITGLVFALVLAPRLDLSGWALVTTILFHYVSPWAAILGWLVFGPRRRFTWATVSGAFVLPVAWLLYTFVHGAFADWYPYPFLDVTRIGLGRAVLNAVLVILVAVVIALILKVIDAKLPSALDDRGARVAGETTPSNV